MANATVPKPVYQERFRIHAYVCDQACVRRRYIEGRVTFAWVYQNRPDDCRYAIVSTYDAKTHWQYEVLDLYQIKKKPETDELIMPKPRLTHVDLDAAVMATVMLYGKEVK